MASLCLCGSAVKNLVNAAILPHRFPARRKRSTVLVVRNLSKSYGGPDARPLLRDINLTLRPGEYIAIMGESGVGKSTLLNLIAGLDTPDAGSVELDGVELTRLDDDSRTRVRRQGMGFVFQAFHLLPYLTVLQNAALPLALNRVPAKEGESRARALLEAVGLGNAASRYPRELSGGEMQRLAIARALVHHPRLVLADEPTGNLDPENGARVLTLLREQILSSGGAGILVTHSPVAAATADHIYRLTPEGLAPAIL